MALTKVIGDGIGSVGDDLSLVSDGSIVNFGVNSEISLTHVHNSGLTLASSVGATTFKIGRAGATDAKVIFDGNAQDYHIGVDDTNDSLVIGLGGTLGTTDSMVINAAGIITKPLQPAFLAVSRALSNIANTTVLDFGTEVFDQNSDYNPTNFTFTAPVTGKYFLSTRGYLLALDGAANYYQVGIETSNRSYYWLIDPVGFNGTDPNYWAFSVAIVADMDAADTALVRFNSTGGTQQADLDTGSHFGGYLLG